MKWEYKLALLTATTIEAAEAALNELGEDGWEVIRISPQGHEVLLKRPKRPPPRPYEKFMRGVSSHDPGVPR